MDDVLIYAKLEHELDKITHELLIKLKGIGLIFNKEICRFKRRRVKFLDHIFISDGVEANPEKIEAINKLKIPSKKEEFQRLLG